MATSAISLTTDESEPCVLCSTKYNRTRPSFCECKHCSIPLCFECMKEHHNEILQDVAQISHQYNELQQCLQMKLMMIDNETTQSIEHVNEYFDSYIKELRETQEKIIKDLETTKQDAQSCVLRIESDLHTLNNAIHGLTKENVVQTTKMNNISKQIQKMKQDVDRYQAVKTENLIKTKPELSIKFDYLSEVIEKPLSLNNQVIESSQEDGKQQSSETSTLNIPSQPTTTQEYLINRPRQNDDFKNEERNDENCPDDNNIRSFGHKTTSYHVHRMASDRENILYTSYYDTEPDIIGYHTMNGGDNTPDIYRDWNQSRILDMIWWDSIHKFICATNSGIYTVDSANKRFKIISVIQDNWSYISVAANTAHLFVWMNPIENTFHGIQVFGTQFEHIRAVDFNVTEVGSFVNGSLSFCTTDTIFASICTRMQRNRNVFQITICDMNMNKLNSIPLGECSDNIEIRTDGKDRFFVTTGYRRFHIIHSNGKNNLFQLHYSGECIAVLNNRRIAIANGHSDFELLTY